MFASLRLISVFCAGPRSATISPVSGFRTRWKNSFIMVFTTPRYSYASNWEEILQMTQAYIKPIQGTPARNTRNETTLTPDYVKIFQFHEGRFIFNANKLGLWGLTQVWSTFPGVRHWSQVRAFVPRDIWLDEHGHPNFPWRFWRPIRQGLPMLSHSTLLTKPRLR